MLSQPPQLTAPKEMKVEVVNHLAGMGPLVEYQAVATLSYPLRPRQFVGYLHHMPQQFLVLCAHVGNGCYMSQGDDEYVGRCLGADIPNSDDVVIAMHNAARHFAGYDSAEDAILVHVTPLPVETGHPVGGYRHDSPPTVSVLLHRPSFRATSSRW